MFEGVPISGRGLAECDMHAGRSLFDFFGGSARARMIAAQDHTSHLATMTASPNRLPELPLVCLKSANCHTTLNAFVGKNTVIGEYIMGVINRNMMYRSRRICLGCARFEKLVKHDARWCKPVHYVHGQSMRMSNHVLHRYPHSLSHDGHTMCKRTTLTCLTETIIDTD